MTANNTSQVTLWSGLIATNSPPTGVAGKVNTGGTSFQVQLPKTWSQAALFINATAGTTPTVTVKSWGYANSVWFPLGVDPTGAGTASKFGLLNDGNAIGPYTGNTTVWSDLLYGLSALDGFYLEATAISGTNAAFSAFLRSVRVE